MAGGKVEAVICRDTELRKRERERGRRDGSVCKKVYFSNLPAIKAAFCTCVPKATAHCATSLTMQLPPDLLKLSHNNNNIS